MSILERNIPLISLIFLKRSLVFPILLFSSISLHWSLRKAFLSLLAILWRSAFRWVYISFSHLPFASLLFSAICKASSEYHFAFLHFFFLKWSEVKSLSCVRLCDPMDCSLPGSSVHGIFQAVVLEWIAISFSRGSSQPRDRTQVFRIVDRRFTDWATREVHHLPYNCYDPPSIVLQALCLSDPIPWICHFHCIIIRDLI